MSDPVYESIVEHSNDGIFVAQDGEIVYANQRLCELTGYEPGELVGRPKLDIVAPDDRELVEGYHFARMSGDSAPNQYEIKLQTADGELVPVELSVSRVEHDGEPRPSRSVGISPIDSSTNNDWRNSEIISNC